MIGPYVGDRLYIRYGLHVDMRERQSDTADTDTQEPEKQSLLKTVATGAASVGLGAIAAGLGLEGLEALEEAEDTGVEITEGDDYY